MRIIIINGIAGGIVALGSALLWKTGYQWIGLMVYAAFFVAIVNSRID